MKPQVLALALLVAAQSAFACDPSKEACRYNDGNFPGSMAAPSASHAPPPPEHHGHSRDVLIGLAVATIVVVGVTVAVQARREQTLITLTKSF